jgi:hypothetical protein
MLTKKLAVLAGTALTLTASAAFAGDYRYRDGYRHYDRHHERVVVRPYYAPRTVYYAPAPVYYAPAPAYYAPAPVYYGGATVGGALIGAIIGNQISDRHHRAVGTAAGAIVGAAIGSSIDRGY